MTNLEVRELLFAIENSEVLGEHTDIHSNTHINSPDYGVENF